MSEVSHQVPAGRRIQTANSGWYSGRLWGTGVTAWNEDRHGRGEPDVFAHSITIMTAPRMGTRAGRLSRWMMRERRNSEGR